MARPHIEFIRGLELPEGDARHAPFAGTRSRLLSADDADGSTSELVAFPAGWWGDLAGFPRPVELFTLRGELEVGGRAAPPGVHAWLPTGAADRRVAAPGETL